MENNIIKLIFKNNGKLFGEYIIEYLIPKIDYEKLFLTNVNPFLSINKNLSNIVCCYNLPKLNYNINVWFTHKIDCENFIENIIFITKQSPDFKFNNNIILLGIILLDKIKLNIYLSDVYPVNDFSINLLSYDGKNLKLEEILTIDSKLSIDQNTGNYQITIGNMMFFSKPLEFTIDSIISQIKRKKFVLLYDYFTIDGIKMKKFHDLRNKGFKEVYYFWTEY